MIIGFQAKRELLTALLVSVKILIHKNFSILHNLNAMGNEIKKPRPFFWFILRLWRPTRVRFLS